MYTTTISQSPIHTNMIIGQLVNSKRVTEEGEVLPYHQAELDVRFFANVWKSSTLWDPLEHFLGCVLLKNNHLDRFVLANNRICFFNWTLCVFLRQQHPFNKSKASLVQMLQEGGKKVTAFLWEYIALIGCDMCRRRGLPVSLVTAIDIVFSLSLSL